MRARVLRLALGGLVVAALGPGAAPSSQAPAEPVRVIVRLADGGARLRALAEATAEADLDVRHARIVRRLRDAHAASRASVRGALDAARAAGGLGEVEGLWIINALVAEVDPAWIPVLEADPAVLEVVPDRELVLGTSAAAAPIGAPVQDPTEDLVRIRVPEVWADGVTGRGAIVANTDTGVNGEDDTFGARWRGRFAGSDAAWYAPVALTVFPEDTDELFSGGTGHGTETMGVLTGGEASFGVAYEATWIAGDVFEGGTGFVSNALRTLQWLADPDGDPTTRADVPDVVSNSYGLADVDPATNRIRCDPIFDDAIDALEAAGAIVVWSAGNEGTDGVTSPANRADSPTNAFAVGGVNAQGEPFGSGSSGSGLGPSACGGPNATKPEIVAPAVNVLTRSRFNEFIRVTGTSFSTPMVAGVLALMRSKDPRITPEAAKTILLETARDLTAPGDDDLTGRGMVDAAAALARVERPSQPLARLVGFEGAGVATTKLVPAGIEDALVLRPGGSRALVPVLSNHGSALPATTATLASPTAGVTVSDATVTLASAATGAFFGPAGADAFTVEVDAGVEPGTSIVLELAVQGAAIGPFRLVLKAGDPVPGDFATHDEGDVRLTVTNFGGLGYYTGLPGNLEGQGFRFPAGGPNWLFHAALMAGTGPERLSDGVPYGFDTQSATDWIPLFGLPVEEDRAAGGERIVAGYDDRKAPLPLGLRVRQESFAFGDPSADAFVVLQYLVTNTTDRSIGGLRLGLFADFDLPGGGGEPEETAGWDPARRLGFVEGTGAQPALGLVWLDDVPVGQLTYAVLERDEVIASPEGDPLAGRQPVPAEAPALFGGEFSDAEKWNALASGQTRTVVATPQDLWQIVGVGPLAIAAGATDTVAVALVAAPDLTALRTAAETARAAYFERILGVTPPPPDDPPDEPLLLQNFPNPFRRGESTTIRFALPEDGGAEATVAVYDAGGRLVRTLRSGPAASGEQAVAWDGRDEEGRLVPPGVYIVRLSRGERTIRVLVLP